MKKENKAMKEKIYGARTGLEYVLVDVIITCQP